MSLKETSGQIVIMAPIGWLMRILPLGSNVNPFKKMGIRKELADIINKVLLQITVELNSNKE
ncbi:MAG: hypothetical protein ACI9QD_000494 [Thermoproteota archaeon]